MVRSIHIDTKKCIGSRTCVNLADTVFGLANIQGELKAIIIEGMDSCCDDDAVQEAIDACPVGAIRFVEASDGISALIY